MPIYLKFDPEVKGDVTEEGHKGWIEVSSCQFGIGRGVSTPVGSAANRETSAPSISEVTVTKQMDASSIPLFQNSLEADEGVKVSIDFCRTEKDKLQVYAQYELSDVIISGYSVSSGGDRPTESLSLNFTKVMFSYDPGDTKGAKTNKASATYDLAAAKTV